MNDSFARTVSLEVDTLRGFATSAFSPEARDDELKDAKGIFCVAMLGPAELEEWIVAGDPDEYLNRLVGKAMLR